LKHAEDLDKHIIEEIVRQVVHLPELYEDARSKEYNILEMFLNHKIESNVDYTVCYRRVLTYLI
jgi:hypothetical protein